MASEQAPLRNTSAQTAQREEPTTKLDMTSEQAPLRNTNAQTAQREEPTTKPDMTSEEAPLRNTSAQTAQREVPTTKPDMTSEQAPLSHTSVESSEPGAPTTIPEAAGGKPSRNQVPYDDDDFNAKAKHAEAQVIGCFQKAFSYLERPTADTTADRSSTEGTGGRRAKSSHSHLWDDHDSIEKQMRNTRAQLVGTLRGLAFAFHQAEQKIGAGFKKTDSSETEVGKDVSRHNPIQRGSDSAEVRTPQPPTALQS